MYKISNISSSLSHFIPAMTDKANKSPKAKVVVEEKPVVDGPDVEVS